MPWPAALSAPGKGESRTVSESAGVGGEQRQTESPPAGEADLSGTNSVAAILVASVAVGIILFLTKWAAPVLAPISLGLILAALASPVFSGFVERGRSATVAMALTILLVVLLGAALVFLSLYSSQQLIDSLAAHSDQLEVQYPQVADALAAIGVPGGVRDLLSPEALVSLVEAAAAAISEIGGNLAFAVVLAALLLLDAPRLARLIGGGLGSDNPVFREYPKVAQAAITYFTIRIRVNAITAGGLLLLMLVLGVDNAILWAIGAFFLSFVPYVGLVLALIPPTILALAESGPGAAIVIVIGGMILNVVAENVLEPSMTGKALSLSSWLVFIMFFFTVWLVGPVGALLAMPFTVLIVLVLQGNERTRWLATLLTRGDLQAGAREAPEAAPAI